MDELSNKTPEIDELFNQYSGKDDGELMQELIQVIAEQKANGTFNEAELMMMVSFIMPMLSPAQAEKLDQILEVIK
ncbi:MAG: hypothetical protein PUC27_04280 [Clostridium sp.]|nr:hypothetical protein [Clostridium sp.]